MEIEFYLITVVHCEKGFAKSVADHIFEYTCIFEKMAGDEETIHIFTDTNSESLESDKSDLTAIIVGAGHVINHRHFITTRYNDGYAQVSVLSKIHRGNSAHIRSNSVVSKKFRENRLGKEYLFE